MKVDIFHYRLPPYKRQQIEDLIEKGYYTSLAEFITEAISHHLRYLEELEWRDFEMEQAGYRKKKGKEGEG